MRRLGNVCVALCMLCVVNIVTTFVPGGPLLGTAAGNLAMVVVFGVICASWGLREAAPVDLPRRLRPLYRALPRPTLVVGLSSVAALIIVVLYDGITINWSEARPRSVFATVGVIAATWALNLYALQAITDRDAAVASDERASQLGSRVVPGLPPSAPRS